jgi:hypothetical protein
MNNGIRALPLDQLVDQIKAAVRITQQEESHNITVVALSCAQLP